jgi:hypothetical protein
MNAQKPITTLFLIAALYDGVLGAAFLLAPRQVFRIADVTPPNHLVMMVLFLWSYRSLSTVADARP